MTQNPDSSGLLWRKSTKSGNNGGQCVETANLPDGGRAVRDSKNPDGPTLVFTAAEWHAFIDGVQAGEDL
ncbi:MAG TPA: DUF397 domain-containing protein [Actinocrinis sp.]|nr:DUF397 domain-containing protein [Actinocrinis sp.]